MGILEGNGMRLESHTHSDSARNPARRFVDGRSVSADEYWEAFDRHSPGRTVTGMSEDRDLHDGQRSRVTTIVID